MSSAAFLSSSSWGFFSLVELLPVLRVILGLEARRGEAALASPLALGGDLRLGMAEDDLGLGIGSLSWKAGGTGSEECGLVGIRGAEPTDEVRPCRCLACLRGEEGPACVEFDPEPSMDASAFAASTSCGVVGEVRGCRKCNE